MEFFEFNIYKNVFTQKKKKRIKKVGLVIVFGSKD